MNSVLLSLNNPGLFFFLILVLFAIARTITVIIHELGHAIIGIILTKNRATIFLGPYGDKSRSIHLKIKKLRVWLKYDNLLWRNGLCKLRTNRLSINQHIFYTVAGSFASLFTSLLCTLLVILLPENDFLKLLLLIMAISGIFDSIYNLIPNNNPIQLFNGNIAYNDGYVIKRLLRIKKAGVEFERGVNYYHDGKFSKAATLFEKLLLHDIHFEELYSYTISTFAQIKAYDEAYEVFLKYEKKFSLSSDDYATSGYIKSMKGFYEEALVDYEKSLKLNPDNTTTLNNRGYLHTTHLIDYQKAIEDLDKAITIDPNHAYSHNNRGYAKIKLGLLEEGLLDINKSLLLDPENAYAYAFLGLYHLEKKEKKKSLELFEKAKLMNPEIPEIDIWIEQARSN